MVEEIRQRIDHLNRQVVQLYQEGQYEQAVERIRIAYETRYVPSPFPALDALAFTCIQRGDYRAAEPLISQSIALRSQIFGEEHPSVLEPLVTKALIATKLGKIEVAREIFEQVLQTRRRILPRDHPDVIASLDDLARFYYEHGDPDKAEPLLRESIEIHGGVSGKGGQALAEELKMLGEIYLSRGELLLAEPLLRNALDILCKTLGEYHPGLTTILGHLSALYLQTRNYAEAEWTNTYILKLVRRTVGEKHRLYATSLERMAQLRYHMGDNSGAVSFYKQILSVQRQLPGENRIDIANTLSSLATIYSQMGEYAQALPLFQETIDIQSRATGEQARSLMLPLLNLGQLYIAMNSYKKAIALFERAFDILSAVSEDRLEVAVILSSLGHVYHNLGDYHAAERFYLHALKSRRRVAHEDMWGQVPLLTSLGALYEMREEYAEACSYLDQALSIAQKLHQEDASAYAIILNNIARLEHAQSNYTEALRNLRQALTIFEINHHMPEVRKVLHNMAEIYAALDQADDALECMKRATTLENRILGQIFSIGTEEQRLAHLQAVRTEMSQILSLIVNSFLHSRQEISTALNLVLQRKALAADALAVQRDTILQGKYRHLQPRLEELALVRSQLARRMLAGPNQEEADVYQQRLEDAAARVEQLESDLARQIPEMNLAQILQSADHQAVAMALPEGAVLIEFARFSLFDFKAVRSQGEFYWQPDRYLAFVQPAREPDNLHMIDLGEADSIDRMISAWRTSVMNEADNRHVSPEKQPGQAQSPEKSAGTDLRVAVFDPLLASMKGCKRLFIAPDGELTRLPFEALPTNDERYLIDEYQISYLSTGRDLLRIGSTAIDQPAPPVVVADPDFDLGLDSTASPTTIDGDGPQRLLRAMRQDGLHFNLLPGTRLEGERIARMLGIQLLSGKFALESSLKGSRSPRILHLATHGFFLKYQKPVILKPEDFAVGMTVKSADPQHRLMVLDGVVANPSEFIDASHEDRFSRLSGQRLENPMLRSGLALAGANTWLKGNLLPTEAEDAILTAEDVSGMDLLATELVVLSACETGLGEIRVGEGVFGLRRAFILAGAKTLIMSLWRVPDQQTQELMVDFYQRILLGQSRIDSLRAAQLALKAKYRDPFYWGAFICQGNPGLLFQL